MSLTQGLISGGWLWAASLAALLVLLLALKTAPWSVLMQQRRLQHLLFGATVVLMLMWTMRAGISPGLGIHFLGMTTLTLMFGWDLAILSRHVGIVGHDPDRAGKLGHVECQCALFSGVAGACQYGGTAPG
jgi:Predicted membrane protein